MTFNWTCPYCDSKTTINDSNHRISSSRLSIDNSEGERELETSWIVCPNEECKKITLKNSLYDLVLDTRGPRSRMVRNEIIKRWTLLPTSSARILPIYIPLQIRQDYEEAAAIIEKSPKASATLSRRCLQGIIRDFWGVKKNRLVDEINEIKDKVDPITWESIDAVRKVGNIGAHMEKNINLIIDVEPEEANMLIQLLELLFVEWYVHKHERELKLKAISEIAKIKEDKRQNK